MMCDALYSLKKSIGSLSRLLLLLRHSPESLHSSSTERSVILALVAIKCAERSNCVTGGKVDHASLVATTDGGKESFTFGICCRLCRSLRESELRALLAALSHFGSPVSSIVSAINDIYIERVHAVK